MGCCTVNELQLNRILGSQEELNKKIDEYAKSKTVIKARIEKEEINGHILKAEHNLKFVEAIAKTGFNDWALVGCYYTLYHIALALILRRGYLSKDHDATLCILIKEYYKEIGADEFKLINSVYLNNEDILFYVKSREERRKASYSTKILFDRNEVNKIVINTRLFLNKAKGILENE